MLVIGIGAGDPGHLTVQAIDALAKADVFFLLDKGREADDLAGLRREIIASHAREPYRVVEVPDPERDRGPAADTTANTAANATANTTANTTACTNAHTAASTESTAADITARTTTDTNDNADMSTYTAAVDDWRSRRADVVERLIARELGDDETGAFLVWGDPALYDGTIAVIEEVLARGRVRFDHTIIPGVSSVSALAARHRIGLTRVGRPLLITTGRRLAEALENGTDDVVVMLDSGCAFADIAQAAEFDIYWGAYLGTPDEILIAGRAGDVAERICSERAAARARKGWIMDTYLLRRVTSPDARPGGGAACP
ncbi:precorrin-6A synthase (deacetylating) [Planotetraspora thailandica]|uniref:Precorrin-6A synthase (Deacetylating) n=1 Tax=Planotetraspora thailandica TaxID=487172 RepID=A0A8J3V823_9ACTN|nr:precorrin-6A synthase (deacetylating) [Planotetraspora thailandica]